MLLIRPATPSDITTMLSLIRALALYEGEPDKVRATERDLLRDGFGEYPRFECLIAEERGQAGDGTEIAEPAGFALYFYSYSTWRGRAGIHLEDLFVKPEFRGRGIGRELLERVAARALEQELGSVGWNVLEWNRPAIDFYESMGAEVFSGWRMMRLEGAALRAAGRGRREGGPI